MSRVPVADETRNILDSHVIGNKADTAVATVGTTASLMAYLKGLLNAQAGAAGLATFPAAAQAANDVSLAEVIRYLSEYRVQCAQTALLATTATGTTDLFTYSGPILVHQLIGVIKTTAMAAAQTRIKLIGKSDSLTGVDLCAALDVTGAAAGTMLNITGTVANAMVATTLGVAIAQAGRLLLSCVTAGKIQLNNADAANAGRVQWYCLYEPLAPGATVAAA